MSMRNCYECAAEVSSRAKACPKCGAKRPGDLKAAVLIGEVGKVLLVIGLILMAGNCLVGMASLAG